MVRLVSNWVCQHSGNCFLIICDYHCEHQKIFDNTKTGFTIIMHSTAQHSTAQHSTAQHSTAQHSTAQHSTAQHSTAQHSTAQLNFSVNFVKNSLQQIALGQIVFFFRLNSLFPSFSPLPEISHFGSSSRCPAQSAVGFSSV